MCDINPGVRVILTVSPVPLVATAEPNHVLAATTYSKSVLRVAAEAAARRHSEVRYFPSYEIVTGPQAPKDFFEADRRSVSSAAVAAVMDAFLSACETTPAIANTPVPQANSPSALLSATVADLECEEAAQAR